MIHQLINTWKTEVMAIPWVERYGGLCRVIKDPRIEGGNGPSYPVTDSVDQTECWEENKAGQTTPQYKRMVPNSKKMSVLYYEQVTPEFTPPKPKVTEMYDYKVTIRLVAWINYQLIGISSNDRKRIISEIMYTIGNHRWTPAQVAASGLEETFINVRTHIPHIDPKEFTINQVFGKYQYNQQNALFMYPYDVVSMPVEVTATAGFLCDVGGIISPITCIDMS